MAQKRKANRIKKSKSRGSGSILQMSAQQRRKPNASSGLPIGVLIAVGALMTAVVLWGSWMLISSLGQLLFEKNDRFVVQRIVTRTDGVLSERLLKDWCGVEPGENLYALDLKKVLESVESEPIISRAVVKRELPGTLKIVVNERTPIARLGRDARGMNWLVDDEGILLNKSFQAKHLPFLLGVTRPHIAKGESIFETRAKDALHALSFIRERKLLSDEMEVLRVSVGNADYLDLRLADGKRLLLSRNNIPNQLFEAAYMLQHDREHHLNRVTFDLRPEGMNAIGTAD